MTSLEAVREKVPRWRKMGYEPYMVVIPGHDFEPYPVVFRALTRMEYEELCKPMEMGVEAILGPLYTGVYTDIIGTALLLPEELPEDLPAATDGIVADAILQASAWVDPQRLVQGLEDGRQYAMTLSGFLSTRVSTAFPAMTMDQIKAMTFSQFVRMVAMSEVITGVPIDLQPWLDPEGYQMRMNKEERRIRLREKGMAEASTLPVKDPALMQSMLRSAEEARARIAAGAHDDINFEKDNEAIRSLGIMPKLRLPQG